MNKRKGSSCINLYLILLMILIIIALIISLIVLCLKKPRPIKLDFNKQAFNFISPGEYTLDGYINPTKLHPNGVILKGKCIIEYDKQNLFLLFIKRHYVAFDKINNKILYKAYTIIEFSHGIHGAVYHSEKNYINLKKVSEKEGYCTRIEPNSLTFNLQGNSLSTGTHHDYYKKIFMKTQSGYKCSHFLNGKTHSELFFKNES